MVKITSPQFFIVLVALFCLGIYLGITSSLLYVCLSLFINLILCGVVRYKLRLPYYLLLISLSFFVLGLTLGFNNSLGKLENKLSCLYEQQLAVTVKVQPQSIREYPEYYSCLAEVINNSMFSKAELPHSIKIKLILKKSNEFVLDKQKVSYLKIQGQLKQLSSFNNPSNINWYKRQLVKKTIGKISVKNDNWQILATKNLNVWQEFSGNLVTKHFQQLKLFLPEQNIAMLKTLTLRPDYQLASTTYQEFAQTGLIHMLCISGTHLSLISLLFYKGCCLLIRNKNLAVIISLICVWIYISLTNFAVPILRAGIMNSLLALGILLNRKAYLPAIFSVTVVFMLAAEPLLILDLTFQLSFLATASLIFIYPKLVKNLETSDSYNFIWKGLLAIISVEVLILPLILINFHRISLVLFLSNFLLVPLLQISIILIFLASFILYIYSPLGKIVFALMALLLDMVIKVNAFLANCDNFTFYTREISPTLFITYYIFLFASFISFRRFKKEQWLVRLSRTTLLVLIIYMLVFIPQNNYLAQAHFIDVGQGDSCLIISKTGKSILIDTGGLESSNIDIGSEVIIPYLNYYGIKQLDYLVLSHAHYDHVGAGVMLAQKMPIAKIVLPNLKAKESATIQRILFFAKNSQIVLPKENQRYFLDNLQLEVLHVPINSSRNENDSLVVLVSVCKYQMLFTGDIDKEIEKSILFGVPGLDLLKVAHHGSKNSTSSEFLARTKPKIAIISAGRNNNFGHPHKSTIKRLGAVNAKIHSTSNSGAIRVCFTKQAISIYEYLKTKKLYYLH